MAAKLCSSFADKEVHFHFKGKSSCLILLACLMPVIGGWRDGLSNSCLHVVYKSSMNPDHKAKYCKEAGSLQCLVHGPVWTQHECTVTWPMSCNSDNTSLSEWLIFNVCMYQSPKKVQHYKPEPCNLVTCEQLWLIYASGRVLCRVAMFVN